MYTRLHFGDVYTSGLLIHYKIVIARAVMVLTVTNQNERLHSRIVRGGFDFQKTEEETKLLQVTRRDVMTQGCVRTRERAVSTSTRIFALEHAGSPSGRRLRARHE